VLLLKRMVVMVAGCAPWRQNFNSDSEVFPAKIELPETLSARRRDLLEARINNIGDRCHALSPPDRNDSEGCLHAWPLSRVKSKAVGCSRAA